MKRLAFAALLLAPAGCGTVENFTEGRKPRNVPYGSEGEKAPRTVPYGGVQNAAERIGTADPIALALAWPIYLADVPLCAVGDTLTLPVTGALAAWPVVRRVWYFTFVGIDNPPPKSVDVPHGPAAAPGGGQ